MTDEEYKVATVQGVPGKLLETSDNQGYVSWVKIFKIRIRRIRIEVLEWGAK